MSEANGNNQTTQAMPDPASGSRPPLMYYILLGLDLIAAVAIVYFFLIGLADGSVSSFNGELWAGLLVGVAAIVLGGIGLHRAGRPVIGNLVLAILALPTALYGLFIILLVFSGESWQ